MNLGDLQKIGQKATAQVLQATQSTQETASELTGKAVRSAIDQAIAVLQVAVQQAQKKDLPASQVDIGACVNIGIIQLTLNVNVPLNSDLEPGDINIDLKSLPSSLQN